MNNSIEAVTALEPRRLFATISGTVFNDLDSSRVLTSNEDPLGGQTVYIDANQNARFDRGERFAITAENGTYRFANLPTGTYNVAQVLPAKFVQTSPSERGSVEGRFDILVRYRTKMTPAQQAAFQIAADRWESLIIGDLADVRTDLGTTDDLIIDASVSPIDGVGSVLGQAGPRDFRDPKFLPSRGSMEFDSADLNQLEADGQLNDVITHEMGHVLGVGTIWDKQRRLRNINTPGVQFIGEKTVAQYNAIFRKTALHTPIESDGGGGTRESHWDEETFGPELMTGFVEDAGTIMPISRITVAQFEDLGYTVNYDNADTFDPRIAANNKLWKPSDAGVLPFQKRIVLDRADSQNNIDFGMRVNNRPSVLSFTAGGQVVKGNITTLSARAVDRDGDKLVGVTFYRESNGTPGLQKGRGGDTYIASKLTSKRGVFGVTTDTDDVPLGAATFYVLAVDTFQTAGRGTAAVSVVTELTPPAAPTNFNAGLFSDGSIGLKWRDRSVDEDGFRIQIATSADFSAASLLKTLNVSANTTAADVDLKLGANTYYLRIRSFGVGGSSAFTTNVLFRAALP